MTQFKYYKAIMEQVRRKTSFPVAQHVINHKNVLYRFAVSVICVYSLLIPLRFHHFKTLTSIGNFFLLISHARPPSAINLCLTVIVDSGLTATALTHKWIDSSTNK